jgi:hypothetical protein
MLETHIVMSSLMFRLAFTLVLLLAPSHVLCLALLLVLCLSSLMDLTIAHMVTVYRVGLIFPLEGPFPTLSRGIWTVHAFPVVVHVPLGQVVRYKGL